MRRLVYAMLLSVVVSSTVGCFVPIYSADPARRTTQMIYTSENMRLLLDEWERFWFLDQPDHMSPYRTHGGVI